MVKRFGGVVGALLAILVSAVTVFAAGVVINKIYSPGQIDSPTQAGVAVKATCDPGARRAEFSVRLQEATNDGTTTGTGSSGPMTCDGNEHRYVLIVTASSGTWTPGAAHVYVSTTYVTCTSTPTGPNCVADETPYTYVTTIQLETRS